MSSYLRIAILAKGEPRFILSPPSAHNTSWVFGLAVLVVRPELPHLDAERWGDDLLRVFHYFLAIGIISATATPTVTSVMPGVLAWLGQQHVVVALAVGPVGVDPSMPNPSFLQEIVISTNIVIIRSPWTCCCAHSTCTYDGLPVQLSYGDESRCGRVLAPVPKGHAY